MGFKRGAIKAASVAYRSLCVYWIYFVSSVDSLVTLPNRPNAYKEYSFDRGVILLIMKGSFISEVAFWESFPKSNEMIPMHSLPYIKRIMIGDGLFATTMLSYSLMRQIESLNLYGDVYPLI